VKHTLTMPPWRYALALALAGLPSAVVWLGLYRLHSAALAFVFYHGYCLVGGLVLRAVETPSTERRFPVNWRYLPLVALLANGWTVILYRFIGAALFDVKHVMVQLADFGLPPSSYRYLFPYFALVNPTVEEFFWRSGVYATMRHHFAHWQRAAVVSSVLFGAWHWLVIRRFLTPPVALLATVAVMIAGYGLTLVYERTRNLAWPIALHAIAADVPILLLLLLMGQR
jgi:membrane protease YdiL (CAAX protease family)